MATITDYNIDQGSAWSADVTPKDTAGDTIVLDPLSTISSQIRKNHHTYRHDTTIPQPTGTILGSLAQSGIVTLSLTAAETAAIRAGYYYYDVEATSSLGVVTRISEGKIHLRPEITKTIPE